MTWIAPVRVKVPEKLPAVVYTGKVNSGRRGTPVTYLGVTYRSLQQAATANGVTKATVRWRLLRK